MRCPYAMCFYGSSAVTINLMTITSFLPNEKTTKGGKILFILCSPIWLCLSLLLLMLGLIAELFALSLWFFCCCGCCGRTKEINDEMGFVKGIGHMEVNSVADHCGCNGKKLPVGVEKWVTFSDYCGLIRQNNQDWCCNDGGCLSSTIDV